MPGALWCKYLFDVRFKLTLRECWSMYYILSMLRVSDLSVKVHNQMSVPLLINGNKNLTELQLVLIHV